MSIPTIVRPLPPDDDIRAIVRLRGGLTALLPQLNNALVAAQHLEARRYPAGELADALTDSLREAPAEPGSPLRLLAAVETFLEEVRT